MRLAMFSLHAEYVCPMGAQLGLGDGGPSTHICQWDGSQPEGRRCTIKPAFLDLNVLMARCKASSWQYGHASISPTDCAAIGPWCTYKDPGGQSHCDVSYDVYFPSDEPNGISKLEVAIEAATSGIPCDVTPSSASTQNEDEGGHVILIAVLVVRLKPLVASRASYFML
jgi:hypothetical protein